MSKTKGHTASDGFRLWFEMALPGWIAAASAVIKDGGTQPPLLLLCDKLGSQTIATVPEMTSYRHKDIVAGIQQKLGGLSQVIACVFVTETWVLSTAMDVPRDQLPKDIADHPDRREAVMFNAIGHGMQLLAMCHIERPANTLGKPTIIDPMAKGSQAEGRMVLDRETKH